MTLARKKAVVTGSTRGIGLAIARALVERGASVVVNGRDGGRVKTACERLMQEVAGADVTGIAADLSSASGTDRLIENCSTADILVNNV